MVRFVQLLLLSCLIISHPLYCELKIQQFANYVEVRDELGRKKIYRHHSEGHLLAIEEYMGEKLYRVQRFIWKRDHGGKDKWQLMSKVWENEQKQALMSECFSYDRQGALVESTLYGNLSGQCAPFFFVDIEGKPTDTLTESYSKRFRYDEATPQALLEESEDNGKCLAYYYDKSKVRCVAELTSDSQHVMQRRFFDHDAVGRVVQLTVDDGVSSNRDDIKKVSRRVVTRIHYSDLDSKSKPSNIEQFSVDLATGKLLKMSNMTSEGDSGNVLDDEDPSVVHQYDIVGQVVSSTDTYGNVTHYEYDGMGRVVKKIAPQVVLEDGFISSPLEQFGYDLFDNRVLEVDPNRGVVKTCFTVRGQPYLKVYQDGSEERFIYSLDGMLKETVDKRGFRTVYERDLLGREVKTTLTDRSGHGVGCVETTYSLFFPFRSVRDGKVITDYAYDVEGRVASKDQHFPGGQQHIEYRYGADGRLVREIKSWGTKDSETLVVDYGRHQGGERDIPVAIRNMSGVMLKESGMQHSTSEAIQEMSVVNDRGQTVRSTRQCDHRGMATVTTFDALNRIENVERVDVDGRSISKLEVRYDLVGNKVRETLYEGSSIVRECSWDYDACYRMTSYTESLHSNLPRTTSYLYNRFGDLEQLVKPDGVVVFYSYNSLGRLEDHYSSDSSFFYHYEYDEACNAVSIQDRVNLLETTRFYDTFGRLLKEKLGNGLVVENSYDAIGRRLRLTLPDHSYVSYDYDPLYLRGISRFNSDGEMQYVHRYSGYNLNGAVSEMSLIGSAGKVHFAYDEKGRCRLVKAQEWCLEIPFDGIDTNGQVIAMKGSDSLGEWSAAFSYDVCGRLVEEKGLFDHQYEYDCRSNRILSDGDRYEVDEFDQLIGIEGSDGTTARIYDLSGNLVKEQVNDSVRYYRYDALDRLVAIEFPEEKRVEYLYDVLNRRLAKSISIWNMSQGSWEDAETFYYLYDEEKEIGVAGSDHKLMQLRVLGTGVMDVESTAEIGAAVVLELGDAVLAPVHDPRGNISCLIDSTTGAVIADYRYSAFGMTAANYPGKPVDNPWLFSSKHYDEESGLIYFGSRHYDPIAGRWLTKDPLGGIDGPNAYVFLHQSPLLSVDLYGLFSWSSSWEKTKSLFRGAVDYAREFKSRWSYAQYVHEELDMLAHSTMSAGFLQFSGYYSDSIRAGKSPYGEELSDKVRVTMANGILNVKADLDDALKLISTTHGDTVVHYVFRPTEGWSKDMIKAILSKFGISHPSAKLLALKWKEMIEEMGGTDGGGTIIHYAHSIGSADTYAAKGLLTPEEQRMIQVITLGSPIMIPNDSGFGKVTNYASRRDGVSLLDPVGFVRGLMKSRYNVELIGTYYGIPFIEHTLRADSYMGLIHDLGNEFVDSYSAEP